MGHAAVRDHVEPRERQEARRGGTGGDRLCLTWPKVHAISVVWRRIMSLTHIYTHKLSSPHSASSTWCSWALGRFTRNAMGREGTALTKRKPLMVEGPDGPPNELPGDLVFKRPPRLSARAAATPVQGAN